MFLFLVFRLKLNPFIKHWKLHKNENMLAVCHGSPETYIPCCHDNKELGFSEISVKDFFFRESSNLRQSSWTLDAQWWWARKKCKKPRATRKTTTWWWMWTYFEALILHHGISKRLLCHPSVFQPIVASHPQAKLFHAIFVAAENRSRCMNDVRAFSNQVSHLHVVLPFPWHIPCCQC